MNIRLQYAENFYPGKLQNQIEGFISEFEQQPDDLTSPVAGVVPHAGWMFSGKIAAQVFAVFKQCSKPDTFILFGTVHNIRQVPKSAVYGEGCWKTPFGNIDIDEDIAEYIMESIPELIVNNIDAHNGEHSLEVQIPFIKYLFPGSKIVPIAVRPEMNAVEIGNKISSIVQNSEGSIKVVGTTDLTHYGHNYGFAPAGQGDKALDWMNENDKSIINLALSMNADEIVEEAQTNHNACGSGALAATVSFARSIGVQRGRLLDYATSYDVIPDPEFTMGVGYAGIVF